MSTESERRCIFAGESIRNLFGISPQKLWGLWFFLHFYRTICSELLKFVLPCLLSFLIEWHMIPVHFQSKLPHIRYEIREFLQRGTYIKFSLIKTKTWLFLIFTEIQSMYDLKWRSQKCPLFCKSFNTSDLISKIQRIINQRELCKFSWFEMHHETWINSTLRFA